MDLQSGREQLGPAGAGCSILAPGEHVTWDGGVLLMAYLLEIHIIDPGDRTIKVTHQFWGESKREVETYKREHLGSCEYFHSAERGGNTIEELIEIDADELPDPEDYGDEFEEHTAS